jgi:hypothetical protein
MKAPRCLSWSRNMRSRSRHPTFSHQFPIFLEKHAEPSWTQWISKADPSWTQWIMKVRKYLDYLPSILIEPLVPSPILLSKRVGVQYYLHFLKNSDGIAGDDPTHAPIISYHIISSRPILNPQVYWWEKWNCGTAYFLQISGIVLDYPPNIWYIWTELVEISPGNPSYTYPTLGRILS